MWFPVVAWIVLLGASAFFLHETLGLDAAQIKALPGPQRIAIGAIIFTTLALIGASIWQTFGLAHRNKLLRERLKGLRQGTLAALGRFSRVDVVRHLVAFYVWVIRGTPLVVTDGKDVLGVIHLKDIVKGGIKERFAQLRKMGIRTVMITGDNPLTARAIAEEAGVDDYLAEATPEDKMALIRKEQEGGKLVAMTGDGTNDAPALAQADVGVAMNTGTSAAKEAGNMVDLDSNPTKLIEIVEIGKQLLITRGALTTFSIANDVAKYFAMLPAMFAGVFPGLEKLNIMHKHTRPAPVKGTRGAQMTPGSVMQIEAPLRIDNVALVCSSCSKPTRVGYRFTDEGAKVRVCRRRGCGKDID